MTRKKVKLTYITNDSARKATFKKRKKGLLKKLSELSILCGIDACGIIYSPYDIQPQVWSSPMEAQEVLNAFKQMPEMQQSKNMINQDNFLMKRISKAKDQLKKQKRDNRKKEVEQFMFQCLSGMSLHHLNMIDLSDLGWMIDQYLKEINKKIEEHKTLIFHNTSKENDVEKGMPDVKMDNIQSQEWFINLMNSQDNFEFGGNEIILPLEDNNHNGLWSNMLFP